MFSGWNFLHSLLLSIEKNNTEEQNQNIITQVLIIITINMLDMLELTLCLIVLSSIFFPLFKNQKSRFIHCRYNTETVIFQWHV